MARKIIVYNSFVHDANPHATLLTRQLGEVEKELLTCPVHDKKALLNERRLIKTKLRGTDLALGARAEAAIHKFVLGGLSKSEALQTLMTEGFTTQAATRLIAAAAVKLLKGKDGVGTPEEVAYGQGWHSRSSETSPYDDPELTKAWEKGRKASRQKSSMSRSYFMGEVRGKRFERPAVRDAITRVVTPHEYKSNVANGKWVEVTAPTKSGLGASAQVKIAGVLTHLKIEGDVSSIVRDSAIAKGSIVTLSEAKPLPSGKSVKLRGRVIFVKPDGTFEVKVITPGLYEGGYYTVSGRGIESAQDGSRDFKSERGFVARLINAQTGGVLSRSEPFISSNSAKKWIQQNALQFINAGKRVKAEITSEFFDPDLAS